MRLLLPVGVVLAASLTLIQAACAQPLKSGDLLPIDKSVTVGTLDNGLKYYIRANRKPEHRALLRLVVNAGSVLERDDQQGLAHFVEHMAFNGTTNFPKQELTGYLESIGMRFGPEVNGYTNFDETVFMLEVPTDSAGVLDKGIDILADWAHNVTFEDAEIEKERGIVIEEWRQGQGAGARILKQEIPYLFKDSRYAERIPIGRLEILESFKPETLRDFYRTWYRPDLMAVVAVGDFDPAAIEATIRDRFGALSTPPDAKPRELFPVPDHDEMLAVVATDRELAQTTVGIYHKLAIEPQKTVGAYRETIVADLYNRMLNARLLELTLKPDPPFIYATSTKGRFIKTKQYYQLGATVREDRVLTGLEAIVVEAERARRSGFTQSELDRHKDQMLRGFEKAYTERDKTESSIWAGKYVTSFLFDGPIPGIEYTYELARQLLPEITLDEVNQLGDEWASERNNVVVVRAPAKPGLVLPSESELLAAIRQARSEDVKPYVDQVSADPLVERPPSPGKVTAESATPGLGLVEWTLANGVHVVLKPTEFKNDEVLLWGFSPGGTSRASDDEFVPAWFAPSLVGQSGVGKFDFVALRKRLAGTVASVSPEIDELSEGVRGSASPRDLETMFQLVYLYFTAARLDSATYLSFRSRMEPYLRNRSADPNEAFSDTVAVTLASHHPRRPLTTLALLNRMDLASSEDFYRDRFADASDFTFVIVGAFQPDAIRPLVETYLGGLPSTGRKETWVDLGVKPPPGIVKKEIHKGQEPRSRVNLTFAGPFEWSMQTNYDLGAMSDALRIKLREVIREEEAGAYDVSVSSSGWKYPDPQYDVTISFGCDPARVDELLRAVFAQIDTLSEMPLAERYVKKVAEAQRRSLEVNLQQNGYWLWALWYCSFYGLDREQILSAWQRIDGLTAGAIQASARNYLRRDRYVQVVLYPTTH